MGNLFDVYLRIIKGDKVSESKPQSLIIYNTPYINEHGDLVIPFDNEPKYHWWNRGQGVYQTLLELKAPTNIIKKYAEISKN